MGIDVDYLDDSLLLIPTTQFRRRDLTKPFALERTFDLVLCLEVAEHLPESSAEHLIASLVASGEVILFSAAIPGQGGTHHVNEQWPPYWRALFNSYGYELFDCFRPVIWDNEDVQIHYRQNMFLFVNRNSQATGPALARLKINRTAAPISVVHPELWKSAHLNAKPTIGNLLRELPSACVRSIRARLRID
jgi:hypothetical protein